MVDNMLFYHIQIAAVVPKVEFYHHNDVLSIFFSMIVYIVRIHSLPGHALSIKVRTIGYYCKQICYDVT